LRHSLFDRRVWLLSGCGIFVVLTLSLVQARTAAFDTLQLTARLMLVLETTLLLSAWLLAVSCIRERTAAVGLTPRGIAGAIVLCLQFALMMLPLLVLHRYPDLLKEGINLPLMLLQQGVLLVPCLLIAYHLMLGTQIQLRFPAWLSGPLVLSLYAWASLTFTRMSQDSDVFRRLNDLFYWNQLWLHLPDFQQLQTDYWTHRIEGSWFVYYLLLLTGLTLLSLVFWLPAALIRDSRETIS
jgi:hypothetical protein